MRPDECGICKHPLSMSVYGFHGGERLVKSCSFCSHAAGEHVFHPLLEFGLWHRCPNGRAYPQSECLVAFDVRANFSPEDREAYVPMGHLCHALAGGVRLGSDLAVAEVLDVERLYAEEALASNERPGRSASYRGGGAPRPADSPRPRRRQLDYSEYSTYADGDRLRHAEHGLGVVERALPDRVIAKFPGGVLKQLCHAREQVVRAA